MTEEEKESGMSEQKQAPSVLRLVNADESSAVISRRTHRFADCSMLNYDLPQTELSEREAGLLGLSECKVCLKRAEGGPGLEAMKNILMETMDDYTDSSAEGDARTILDGLKKRGFYLSQRKVQD